MSRVFCDMDGVLADFDAGYAQVMGRPITKRDYQKSWAQEDWDALHKAAPEFFAELPPMPDAHVLWAYIAPHCPTILTGIPRELNAARPDLQKKLWAARQPFLGPQVPIIPCQSKDKSRHAKPGDILIDDWEKYRHVWEAMGGVWVTHTDAESTIEKLKDLGL